MIRAASELSCGCVQGLRSVCSQEAVTWLSFHCGYLFLVPKSPHIKEWLVLKGRKKLLGWEMGGTESSLIFIHKSTHHTYLQSTYYGPGFAQC